MNEETMTGRGLLSLLHKDLLVLFAQTPHQTAFYLTGETALAEYYLGHRRPSELNFLTIEADAIMRLASELVRRAAEAGLEARVAACFASYAELDVRQGDNVTRLTLALDAPQHFEDPLATAEGIFVSSYPDLLVERLMVFYGRALPCDAFDLFTVLQGNSRQNLLEMAVHKDCGFDRYSFVLALQQCATFADEPSGWGIDASVPFSPRQIKQFFADWERDLLTNAV